MKKLLLLFVVLLSVLPNVHAKSRWQAKPEWGKVFSQHRAKGTFLLYDLKRDTYLVWDRKRAETRFIPASTFKIFNSLVGLETGVVKSPDEVFKWDGVQRGFGKKPIPEWNKDQNLRDAFANSSVWVYKEVARRVGQQRMQLYISRAGYGNRDIGGGIDKFWLTGDLRISPVEQIGVLVRLYKGQLPFSSRTQAQVRDIMVAKRTPRYTLRAKTGWANEFSPSVGWYVGYVERGGRPYFFALQMDMDKQQGGVRKAITNRILRGMKLVE